MLNRWECPLCGWVADSVLILGSLKDEFMVNGECARHLSEKHDVKDVLEWIKANILTGGKPK